MDCSDVVPGFLRTPGYATALLSTFAAFRETPDDVSEVVQARIRRYSVIRERNHHLAIVLEELAPRYRIADADTMAPPQIGHLVRFAGVRQDIGAVQAVGSS